MKKRLIVSLILIVAIVALSTAFMPFYKSKKTIIQTNLVNPEAGYIENIGE
jgi:uncharacterized protein involved in outer membrane biogenesis